MASLFLTPPCTQACTQQLLGTTYDQIGAVDMADGKLNDKAVRAAKVESGEKYIADNGGLYLRVRAGDAPKVWFYRYTMNGIARKIQLGVFGDGEDYMSLAKARTKANEKTALRSQGIDPVIKALEDEAARLAAAEAVARAAATLAARRTVAELLDEWQADYLSHKRKDGGAEIRRSFVKDIIPVLGEVKVEDVTRGAIKELLAGVVRRGSKVIANYLLGDMKQMFKYAISSDFIARNPCDGLSKADFGGKKVERDRVLSEAEIKELQTKIPSAKLQNRTEAALWLMLGTGCRVGELSQARWAAVDLASRVWTIPKQDAKNGKAHRIYLSDFAVKWFESIRSDEGETKSEWIFPATRKPDEHVDLKSVTKQVADRQRDTPPMSNRSSAVASLKLSGGSWKPHDLRRTAATMAGGLGVQPMTIERMLNHQNQNPLIRIYQRQDLEAEQREGWRLLANGSNC